MAEPRDLSLFHAGELMRKGQLSAEGLVLSCLERIEARQPEIRAWVTLDAEGALEAARRMDREARARRWRGPLHGIPLGIKDIFDVKGMETKAGSEAYEGGIAERDADSVARLREAGAIFLGKTVTTEFAHRHPSATRNPWNTAHTPGGSSSGTGAAVGDRMCLAGLGSQTAGSVLRPAAFNGVVGFKPSYGAISTAGVVPLSWQLDHVGCLTRKVEDAHLLWHLMRTEPAHDWQATEDKLPPALRPRAPLRIWRVREFFEAESAPECLLNLEKACLRLEKSGARIVEKPLPRSFTQINEVHQIIMATEAATYHRDRFAERRHLYTADFSELVEDGKAILGTDYLAALRRREIMREEIALAMSEVDLAITPGSTTAPPKLTENTTGNALFQRPWSLCGLPSLSLPTEVNGENLPLAVQLVAAEGQEERLLQYGGWCESLFAFDGSPPQ